MMNFIEEVNTAYCEADKDRAMLERALDITSVEMMELYDDLKADMQKRLEVERELRDAQGKIFASQKHEALGQLAGNIAHDFNNILAIIKGFAELLELDLKDMPKYHADLQEIILAAERGRGLTGQILAYAKHQQFDLRVMNLNQVINKYAAMLGAALGVGVALKLELNAPDVCASIDETYFSQILLNLTVNARDAMGGKGEFSIRSRHLAPSDGFPEDKFANDLIMRHRAEAVANGGDSGREYVCVEFSDTGTGIPEDAIPRIFEPYFTTKEMGKGTGLGLAVVYGIVKQMEGYIFCSSRQNEGTTFRLLLPVAAERPEAEKTHDGEKQVTAADSSQIRVLVVDDEKPLRDVVTQHLRSDKIVVQQAENGEAAVSYIRTHRGEIDLVLTDIMMPGMTGFEMAAEIRYLQPDIRILFMSGFSEVALNHDWQGEERRLLEKPFSGSELLAGVYDLMASR